MRPDNHLLSVEHQLHIRSNIVGLCIWQECFSNISSRVDDIKKRGMGFSAVLNGHTVVLPGFLKFWNRSRESKKCRIKMIHEILQSLRGVASRVRADHDHLDIFRAIAKTLARQFVVS